MYQLEPWGSQVLPRELSLFADSPIAFTVNPSKPDPSLCTLTPPKVPQLFTDVTYTIRLKAYDKFSNECTVGGLTLNPRLQLVRQALLTRCLFWVLVPIAGLVAAYTLSVGSGCESAPAVSFHASFSSSF